MLELGTGKTSYCIAFNVYHKFLIYFLLLSVTSPFKDFLSVASTFSPDENLAYIMQQVCVCKSKLE